MKPLIITAGEPAGIGPDIVLQLAQQAWEFPWLVAADKTLLQQRAEQLHYPITLIEYSSEQTATQTQANQLTVLPISTAEPVQAGTLNAANAEYVLQTLIQASQACLQGEFSALVTAPIHKGIIADSGKKFSGHTEFLAQLTNTEKVVMMLACPSMRVALVTTHCPLSQVPELITPDHLTSTIKILHSALQQQFHIEQPCIAVCGLNPHAGEQGHLGREEIDVIIPVLDTLNAQGYQLLGPIPADTAFNKKMLDQVDVVLTMYHDQGLPVLKHAGFGQAINMTLGLPFIRTSVDHGTALDIAGTGEADASSLSYALNMAAQLVRGVC